MILTDKLKWYTLEIVDTSITQKGIYMKTAEIYIK